MRRNATQLGLPARSEERTGSDPSTQARRDASRRSLHDAPALPNLAYLNDVTVDGCLGPLALMLWLVAKPPRQHCVIAQGPLALAQTLPNYLAPAASEKASSSPGFQPRFAN
jgi:hypothetical protein